jgi:hypothetical protein
LLLAFTLAAVCARADTITLKDGTVLEGEITAEDDSSLSIYLEFAGGTITETRHLSKTDVAKITRWTPEQRVAWQAKRDYEGLGKYQLNPSVSYRLDDYNRIIRDHPGSAYTSNVTTRIAQWEAERNLVAAGKMKFHGQWLPAAEGMRLAEGERGQQLLQQSRRLISQGRLEIAIQELEKVLPLTAQPDLVSQARTLLASTFQQTITSLNSQRQQLEADVASAQQRVNQAQQAVNSAEGPLRQSTGNGQSLGRPSPVGSSYQALGANSQSFVQDQTSLNNARNNLANEQGSLDQAKGQLDNVVKKLAAIQSQASTMETRWGIAPGNANSGIANAPPTAVSPAANSPDVLVGLATWFHNNWIFMLAGGLVLLFLLSRFVTG